MSHRFKKILLVTNKPSDARGAEQTALKLAKTNGGSVVIVDSIRTPFHAPRYHSLSAEIMFDSALKAKTEYLDSLVKEFGKEKVSASSTVLFSARTSEDLIGKAIADHCDLLIRYLKGQSSRAGGRFGQTAENLMRACPIPVLLTETTIEHPKVLACINLEHGVEENQAILEAARSIADSPKDVHVLCCWQLEGREFMIEYVDEEIYEQSGEHAKDIYDRLFESFKEEFAVEDLDGRLNLVEGNPIELIPKFCADNQFDIAVMCSASLNHPLKRAMGSTIERVIRALPCSLMVVKPIGFKTSVRPFSTGASPVA